MSKVDGKFMFSPISVNFLTEAAKVIFAIVMLLIQVYLHFIISNIKREIPFLFSFFTGFLNGISADFHNISCGKS